jgi:hypothetical protein
MYFLNHITAKLGWRLACVIGPVLALIIIYVHRPPVRHPWAAAR